MSHIRSIVVVLALIGAGSIDAQGCVLLPAPAGPFILSVAPAVQLWATVEAPVTAGDGQWTIGPNRSIAFAHDPGRITIWLPQPATVAGCPAGVQPAWWQVFAPVVSGP